MYFTVSIYKCIFAIIVTYVFVKSVNLCSFNQISSVYI